MMGESSLILLRTQNLVAARPWGFKSLHPHQLETSEIHLSGAARDPLWERAIAQSPVSQRPTHLRRRGSGAEIARAASEGAAKHVAEGARRGVAHVERDRTDLLAGGQPRNGVKNARVAQPPRRRHAGFGDKQPLDGLAAGGGFGEPGLDRLDNARIVERRFGKTANSPVLRHGDRERYVRGGEEFMTQEIVKRILVVVRAARSLSGMVADIRALSNGVIAMIRQTAPIFSASSWGTST